MLTHASLFSGIGGFDLAAEWAGWENIFHCEWNPFGQKVLAHHFPNSKSYNDITKTNFSIHQGTVDVLTGGFPCQPYSLAGKRLGKADERHLFPEMLRAIKEIKPRWIIGENVRGLVSWNGGLVFDEVCADLESQGYEVQPFLIPAASVNAPHKRDRIWFVAYSNHKGRRSQFNDVSKENGEVPQWNQDTEFSNSNSRNVANSNNKVRGGENNNIREWENTKQESYNRDELWNNIRSISKSQNVANSNGFGLQGEWEQGVNYKQGERRNERLRKLGNNEFGRWEEFPTQPPICGGNDGISRELDGITFPKWRQESIKAYGNAIVPQVALQIFKAINEFELLVK
jgi:DNA (cytosine-5)-methyltransferase 1